MAKKGRPRIQFDLEMVEKYAALGCVDEEIADLFGCSRDTIADRKANDPEFSDALKRGRATVKISIRRVQLAKALGGNVGMLIWLGKQLLGQREHVKVDAEHTQRREALILPQNVDEESARILLEALRGRAALPGSAKAEDLC